MWASLGMGRSMKQYTKNFSPYLHTDYIDPKWLDAMGTPVPPKMREAPVDSFGAWRPHALRGAGVSGMPTAEKVSKLESDERSSQATHID